MGNERMTKDQIKGMMLGVAIGDALGMPVETFSPAKILEKYPETGGTITEFLVPTGHKWFDGRPAGTWTDDTQLTLAVANALLESGQPDMEQQVRKHIDAFNVDVGGWGKTTRESVRRLMNNVHYSQSGELNPKGGKGNGIPMKVAPIGAWYEHYRTNPMMTVSDQISATQGLFEFLHDLTVMTHPNQMSVVAGFSHVVAISRCLRKDSTDTIAKAIAAAALRAKEWREGDEPDDLAMALQVLPNYSDYDPDRCDKDFGHGSCYCFHSLPFSYMYFLRNPHSINALYDVVSAGGDADTNGSMVGALLGALNGQSIFPKHLWRKLDQRDMIMDVAEAMAKQFDLE